MPIPRSSRVYVDSNVFVYHLIEPQHPQERHCEQLLREIERGNLTGVVNNFVTTEVVGTANWILSKARDRELTPQELQEVQKGVEREFDRLGFEVRDADRLIQNPALTPMFQRARLAALSTRAVRVSESYWKSLGGPDGIHVSLAERSAAAYLATCDRAFEGLNAAVTPAILEEEYP